MLTLYQSNMKTKNFIVCIFLISLVFSCSDYKDQSVDAYGFSNYFAKNSSLFVTEELQGKINATVRYIPIEYLTTKAVVQEKKYEPKEIVNRYEGFRYIDLTLEGTSSNIIDALVESFNGIEKNVLLQDLSFGMNKQFELVIDNQTIPMAYYQFDSSLANMNKLKFSIVFKDETNYLNSDLVGDLQLKLKEKVLGEALYFSLSKHKLNNKPTLII